MAKIKEQYVILKISSLIKDQDKAEEEISNELVGTINNVVEELVREEWPGAVVEIEQGDSTK